jgi:3'-5' exoribonuclease
MTDYIDKLTRQAKLTGCGTYKVCKSILEDERFPLWSGSSKENQHHYGKGGLVQHTSEVVDTCFRIKSLYEHKYEFNSAEVFLAAFFHDVGKMWDYEPLLNSSVQPNAYMKWTSAPHKRLIHHISRSALIWSENVKKSDFMNEKYHDKVLHAILAHHTAREFGSPVAPKTRVAWLLTLCDNLSARMYDADTLDILDRR